MNSNDVSHSMYHFARLIDLFYVKSFCGIAFGEICSS